MKRRKGEEEEEVEEEEDFYSVLCTPAAVGSCVGCGFIQVTLNKGDS